MDSIIEHNNTTFKDKRALINHFYLKKVLRLIKKYNKSLSFENILDVGCLDGSFLKLVSDKFNIEPHGVDICEEGIKKALNCGVNAKVANVEKELPYNNETFDLIVCCDVLEHIMDTDHAILEMKRVLKKDGILIIDVPNAASLHARYRLLFQGLPSSVDYHTRSNSTGHIRSYCPKRIAEQLNYNGLKILETTSPNLLFPSFGKKFPGWFENLLLDLSWLSFNLGGQTITVSKKTGEEQFLNSL